MGGGRLRWRSFGTLDWSLEVEGVTISPGASLVNVNERLCREGLRSCASERARAQEQNQHRA